MKAWTDAQLKPWLAALKAGEVVAAPAEGIYGYSVDPFNLEAIERLIQRKQREGTHIKRLIVLISDPSQLTELCPELPPACHEAIAQYWPCAQNNAVTLILPALPDTPAHLMGQFVGTLALRCPSTPYMREYLEAWGGPLVSTSLNITGQPPAVEANQVPANLPALLLDNPLAGKPSGIYNPLTQQWYR